MADVDGTLMGNSTFDPLSDGREGGLHATVAESIVSEPLGGTQVFNSTSSGGGGGTIVRQNPELVRTNP